MKKNFYVGLIALTALTVTSCSNDDVVMQSPEVNKAIEFGTYVGRDAVSRGHVTSIEKLAEEGFGVFAYYTNGGDFVDSGTEASTPNFMYNQKVTGTDAGNDYNWSYSPLKYWPNENTNKLTFFAYAPYDANEADDNNDQTIEINNIYLNLSENTAKGNPAISTYLVPDNVGDQIDLLYADRTELANLTKQTINEKVNFKFKHALSRIGFKVQTLIDRVNDNETADNGTIEKDDDSNHGSALDESTVITIESVVMNFGSGYLSNGRLDLGTGQWSFDGVTAGSKSYTLSSSNFADFSTNKIGNTAQQLNNDESYIMIIPQFLDRKDANDADDAADDINIVVTYKVKTTDGNLSEGFTEVTNVMTSKDFTFKFEQGKAYNFVLHLGLTSVKLTAEVANWDPTDGTDYAVNVPLNTGNNQ